jgi:hypothetical protein
MPTFSHTTRRSANNMRQCNCGDELIKGGLIAEYKRIRGMVDY